MQSRAVRRTPLGQGCGADSRARLGRNRKRNAHCGLRESRDVARRPDTMTIRTDHILIRDGVASALAAQRPVVALETTLVTHGLPHPQGVEVARELEQIVSRAG